MRKNIKRRKHRRIVAMRRIPWKPHVVQLEPESDFLDHGTGLVALNIVRKRMHH